MSLKRLTTDAVKRILDALHPRFLGRDQDHLVALADETADDVYTQVQDYVQPLYDFRNDIESTAGAGLVGVADAGGYYTGVTVENVLQELPSLFYGVGTLIPWGNISGKPTTLAGYGITDAALDASVVHKIGGIAESINGQKTFTGGVTVQSNMVVGGAVAGAAGIELGNTSGVAATAYIDFHSGATVTDYDVRISSSGGNGTPGNGTLTIDAATVALPAGDIVTIGTQSAGGVGQLRIEDAADARLGWTKTSSRRYTAGTNGSSWTLRDETAAADRISVTSAGAVSINGNPVGTLTSVAVANATGITWTGSPITSSGTLTPALSANLQSWSGIAPATKADDSSVMHLTGAESASGTKNFTGTLQYGGIEVGYRNTPRVTAGLENGKMLAAAAGVTVPSSAAGDTYGIYNGSAAAITLTPAAGVTMRLAGTATTGARTLAQRGVATLWYNTATEVIVTGNVT